MMKKQWTEAEITYLKSLCLPPNSYRATKWKLSISAKQAARLITLQFSTLRTQQSVYRRLKLLNQQEASHAE
jgi:hypothetical protein